MGLREAKKLQAWRDIRSAALRLFDTYGYDVVSIEQIAAEAGVSRATFFNYFKSKESVVFDRDPEERQDWREQLAARPADEPLWDSLAAIILSLADRCSDVMPMQRRLKEASPALAQSVHEFGEQFTSDLHDFVRDRAPGQARMHVALLVNLAVAAGQTAYQAWEPDAPFREYRSLLEDCLQASRPHSAP